MGKNQLGSGTRATLGPLAGPLGRCYDALPAPHWRGEVMHHKGTKDTKKTAKRETQMNHAGERAWRLFFLSGFLLCVLCASVVSSAEPPAYPDKARLLVLRDEEGRERPVRTAADWALRREHILAAMQQVMGP